MKQWMLPAILFASGCVPIGPGYTDFSADFGNNCELFQSSAHEVRISVDKSLSEAECVPSKVVQCGHDDRFIVAKQQKLDAKRNPISGQFQFWIVDAPAKTRHGPFTEAEYTAKRRELGVPESVKLRSVNSYRR